MRLVESPRGDVWGRRVAVSAAPAEPNMPSSIGSRLKHTGRGAGVFTDRAGPRVSLRLPRTAG